MGWDWHGNDVDVDKQIDVDVKFDFDTNVDVKIEKETDIDVKINADVDVKGNSAELTFDVEALGKDTYTQLDFVVLTVEDELSSITGYAVSAVD